MVRQQARQIESPKSVLDWNRFHIHCTLKIMVLRTQRYTGRVAHDLHSSPTRFAASQLKTMLKRSFIPALVIAPFVLTFACGGESSGGGGAGLDKDNNKLADDLGSYVDANKDGNADLIDINRDNKLDGFAVDRSGKGTADALALDMDCDGIYDSLDTSGDGLPDWKTGLKTITTPAGCNPVNPVTGGGTPGGSGGAPGVAGGPPVTSTAGATATGGTGAVTGSAGRPGTAGSPPVTAGAGGGTTNPDSQLGMGTYQGSGDTTGQYAEDDVYRNGVGYKFIANGWGKGWQSHSISWKGTSFIVKSLSGTQGSDYSPAGYPTMFCGLYSKKQSEDCGLPITITAAKSIKTGWRWKANGNAGQYNAAWDIWLGNGGTLSSYLMVWLRDPPGQQPAGSAATAGATVTGLPGTWTIWKGMVNGLPIVNYVQPEGKDLSELEFNVLDVYNDAIKRNFSLPGQQFLAVAVGYEIWNGPVSNIATDDFYVDVK